MNRIYDYITSGIQIGTLMLCNKGALPPKTTSKLLCVASVVQISRSDILSSIITSTLAINCAKNTKCSSIFYPKNNDNTTELDKYFFILTVFQLMYNTIHKSNQRQRQVERGNI